MTLPRPIHAGETILVQRRCLERRFFLLPDALTVSVFQYCLALASQQTGVLIHEYVMMSNHYHLVLTDPYCTRPMFFQRLNSLIARALNSYMGRWESFWAPGSYQAPVLLGAKTILRKCVYTLNNPVEAGLVRYPWDFGSASSWAMEYGQVVEVKRPQHFFSENLPERVALTLHRPPTLYEGLDDRQVRAKVREAAKDNRREIIRELKDRGVTFLGWKRVLKQPRHGSPQTRAERRGIHPTVAGPSKWARLEKLQMNKGFQAAYQKARTLFMLGEREVTFPAGTYGMRVQLGVAVAA